MEICLEDIASPTIHCNNEPMVFGICYIRTVVPPRNTDMPFPHTMHVRRFQDSHPWGLSPAAGGVEVCRAPSSCRKTQNRTLVCLFQTDFPEEEGRKKGNVLFNAHSTHFIYGYMASVPEEEKLHPTLRPKDIYSRSLVRPKFQNWSGDAVGGFWGFFLVLAWDQYAFL